LDDGTPPQRRQRGDSKQILAGQGAAHLTLRRVASLAGVSLGTVQYYFHSKDKLLETCLADDSASLRAQLEAVKAALAAGAALEDVLAAGVSAVYRRGLRTREMHRLRMLKTMDSALIPDSPGPFLLGELRELAELVRDQGGISASDARMIVQSVAILVARYTIFEPSALRTLLLLDESDDVADAVDRHLQVLSRALLREYRARAAESAARPEERRS
jgi:AcrR family transcriptional regulator